jgi:Uma2 family endonuclease
MEAVVEHRLYSVEEYLELEKRSEMKHEYIDGTLIEMPGESKKANRIAVNLTVLFDQHLSNYDVYSHDVKLKTVPGKRYRYPDVMVAPTSDADDDEYVVSRAVLLAEITSESSMETDHHVKLHEYASIESVQVYLIISQKEPLVEVYQRQGSKWEFAFYSSLEDTITLHEPALTLQLADIYRKVNF